MLKRFIAPFSSFFLLGLLLLAGCRAGGPGGAPARTVAAFFNKYDGQPGFHTTQWSADLLQRLALVKAAKLLGGSELTDGITGIRSARFISFVPVSAAAQGLAREGLRSEAAGVLQNERYTTLSAGAAASSYQVSTRGSGDKVAEFAAVGQLPDEANSFVLVSVQGNFTQAQVQALSKYLPALVQATGK
ncbi:DUF4252 domain-containing protein [Hymenobacter coccineus]|uniref:DUF4252 domain-containing protein n=1 Tax=Hymenobacter coccineus TaxID=1908235 RepID=A0A1G1TMJ2_9BACT|nr:DUF4252 domain-containing protein [Hymenobacter coccineus]OGX92098.1 hypothetical protein BEN49_17110 [Hymenobacter coccineus]